MNTARAFARAMTLSTVIVMSACAGLGTKDPLNVNVVGIEPLPGEGMEGRFMIKLRVQNPNEEPVEYDGVSVELDVRGSRFATGVSDEKGTVPRFGEAVVSVPVTIPVSAMVRQAVGLATGDRTRFDYELRGKLAGPMLRSVSFKSTGELALPAPQ
jgi:LEA14-like dessication related protein